MNVRRRYIPYDGKTSGSAVTVHVDSMSPDQNRISNSGGDNAEAFSYLNGIQVTESESHTGWNSHVRGRFNGDLGGPFSSVKRYATPYLKELDSISHSETTYPLWFYPAWYVVDRVNYHGPCLPTSPNFIEFPPSSASDDNRLTALGTTAISRCSPSNASVDLTVGIGELFKDGIPAIVGGTLRKWRDLGAKERRRSIGKEYLNVEFGWKPLVNDLLKLSDAIVNAHEILNQYERNSGKLVRRTYSFPPEEDSDSIVAKSNTSPWISPSSAFLFDPNTSNQGKVIRSYTMTRRQWFSGAFTYYVPPSNSLRNEIARNVIQARKLLGISLTPDSLWNLAPWSWAVDWFFNVGDVLSNWTDWAIDNQVLVYGYLMEHSISKYTYTFTGPTGFKSGGSVPTSVSTVCETKLRKKATPYGFGMTWDGFSARQLSIVAALGISRSK